MTALSLLAVDSQFSFGNLLGANMVIPKHKNKSKSLCNLGLCHVSLRFAEKAQLQ